MLQWHDGILFLCKLTKYIRIMTGLEGVIMEKIGNASKYPESVKIQAREMLIAGMSPREVATVLRKDYPTMSDQVVYAWRKKMMTESPEEFNAAREARKEEFIRMAHDLIDKRIRRALEQEEQMDRIVEEIERLPSDEVTDYDRRELRKLMSNIRVDDVAKISTVMGVLYDKQALASKDATALVDGDLKIKKFEDY